MAKVLATSLGVKTPQASQRQEIHFFVLIRVHQTRSESVLKYKQSPEHWNVIQFIQGGRS